MTRPEFGIIYYKISSDIYGFWRGGTHNGIVSTYNNNNNIGYNIGYARKGWHFDDDRGEGILY